MLKIPFHVEHCCNGGNVIFSCRINPFFFFYDKKELGVEVVCHKGNKVLLFQKKTFIFKKTVHKTLTTIDAEVERSRCIFKNINLAFPIKKHFKYADPQKKLTFKIFNCSNKTNLGLECGAHIIENEDGFVQLQYNYKHLFSNLRSFDYFWDVEFKKNKNKYFLSTALIEDNGLALIQDNFITVLKCFTWRFISLVPILEIFKFMKWDTSFLLRTDTEIGAILIKSNFDVSSETTKHIIVSNNVKVFVIVNLYFLKLRFYGLYTYLKKINQSATDVLIFANFKGKTISITLNYFSMSQGIKTITLNKHTNFFKFIV